MKVGDQQLPAYHIFLGGSYEGDDVRFGSQLRVRLPAKRSPEATERILAVYERERQTGEAFNACFDRIGQKPFETAIADLALPGEFTDDNQGMFIDWGKLDLYQLQRGEGECAV